MSNAEVDAAIMEYLARGRATAWAISKTVRVSRADISLGCQRLKRRGLISCEVHCWQIATKAPDTPAGGE